MVTKIQNTPWNILCLKKADFNALLILLITLHCRYKQSKYPNSLTCRRFSRFLNSAIRRISSASLRPTSTRCKGPVFTHKICRYCLKMNPVHWRTFILCAIACPSVIHGIDWSSCLKQRCQNLTCHKHSLEGGNMYWK